MCPGFDIMDFGRDFVRTFVSSDVDVFIREIFHIVKVFHDGILVGVGEK